jgi:hypothetical protein
MRSNNWFIINQLLLLIVFRTQTLRLTWSCSSSFAAVAAGPQVSERCTVRVRARVRVRVRVRVDFGALLLLRLLLGGPDPHPSKSKLVWLITRAGDELQRSR